MCAPDASRLRAAAEQGPDPPAPLGTSGEHRRGQARAVGSAELLTDLTAVW